MLLGKLCQREDAHGVRCGLPAVEEREVVAFGARARVYLCEACAEGRRVDAPESIDAWADGFAVARVVIKSLLDAALRDAMRAGLKLDGLAANVISTARVSIDTIDADVYRNLADKDVTRRDNLLDGLSTWLREACDVNTSDDLDDTDTTRRTQYGALRECLDDAVPAHGGALTDDALRVYDAARDRARLALRCWLDRFDTDALAAMREAVLRRQKREADALTKASGVT